MKWSTFSLVQRGLWLLLSVFSLRAIDAQALVVGPDENGRYSIDSDEVGGTQYQFIDISGTGSRLTFYDAEALPALSPNADEGVAPNISLAVLNDGAGFPFYGELRSEVHMSSNGFLTFDLDGRSDNSSNVCPLPSSGPNTSRDMIAVLWDDLLLSNPPSLASGGYVQSFVDCPVFEWGAGACVIFQWNNASHSGSAATFDLQAVLFEDGTIRMIYGPGNPELGSSSTTGIQNGDATLGLTHVCNSASSISDSSTITFVTPTPSLELIATVGENNVECATAESIVLAGPQSVYFCYTAINTGNVRLNRHDIGDAFNGPLLTDFPFSLMPGASAFLLQESLPMMSVANTSTWTARPQVGAQVTAVSTVNVLIGDCELDEQDSDGDGFFDCNEACPFTPEATTPDRCGVCGGDGSACLGCTVTNTAQIAENLTAITAAHARIINKGAAQLIRRSDEAAAFARRIRKQGRIKAAATAALQSGFATESRECTNSSFCVSTSAYVAEKTSYLSNSISLDLIAKRLARRLKAAGGKVQRLKAQSQQRLTEAQAEVARIPNATSSCS